jgi:hypothetical protein
MPGLNVGDLIVGMRLRLDSSINQDYPIGGLTWNRFDILLGVGQSSLGLTYASNYIGVPTTVRSGSIDFSTPSPFFPATGGPNGRDWSELITFTTPYAYTGGNLVIETRTVTPMDASLVIDVMGNSQTMTQNIVTLNNADATMADASLGVRQRGWAIDFEVVAVPEPSAWAFGGLVVFSGTVVSLVRRLCYAGQASRD